MQITLITVGKISAVYLKQGIEAFRERIKHYVKLELIEIADVKNSSKLPSDDLKKRESELICKHLTSDALIILLDEKGKQMSSVTFAHFLEQQPAMNGNHHLIFIIGGALGVHSSLHKRVKFSMSLSDMTFTHQMVRLLFLEQLYRAFTIIRGIPYHNN